ncbi:hypothetical protein [Methylobacterium gnaphalii]|uniref:Uncharacterized protein n=1 Tax=Methylobacterium gnaphalii TaxID=1010610 RepID=A0A512JID9_9HYPH|nr:hypothetical protein [Methylobacterium gnaphalii]GEP09706.1 hypothetical protein MGN01_15510 [Methylobacterium gnaphalii]GJD67709.1 hypothetical protein MMMDOFMJ_0625 [Methylobacterium gnaphalii]
MNRNALRRETEAALAAEERAHRPPLRRDGFVSDEVQHEQARVFRMYGRIESFGGRSGQAPSEGARRG